jgi:hypothetical protein
VAVQVDHDHVRALKAAERPGPDRVLGLDDDAIGPWHSHAAVPQVVDQPTLVKHPAGRRDQLAQLWLTVGWLTVGWLSLGWLSLGWLTVALIVRRHTRRLYRMVLSSAEN